MRQRRKNGSIDTTTVLAVIGGLAVASFALTLLLGGAGALAVSKVVPPLAP